METPAGDAPNELAQNSPAENAIPASPDAATSAEMTPGENSPTDLTADATAENPATANATAPGGSPFAPLPIESLPPAPPGTQLLLTKEIEIQAKFGKIKLRAGTPVKLIQQTGATLAVRVPSGDAATVPASSTNLGAVPVPVPAPAPIPPAPEPLIPAPLPPAPAAPAPATESLFGPAPTPARPASGTMNRRVNPASDL